jgi:archaellum component FlaC
VSDDWTIEDIELWYNSEKVQHGSNPDRCQAADAVLNLCQELRDLRMEKEHIRGECTARPEETTLAAVKRSLAEREHERDIWKKGHAELKEHGVRLDAHAGALKEAKSERDWIRKQRDLLEKELRELKKSISERPNEVAQLRTRYAQLECQLSALTEQASKEREDLLEQLRLHTPKELKAKVERLQKCIKQLDSRVESLTSNLEEAKGKSRIAKVDARKWHTLLNVLKDVREGLEDASGIDYDEEDSDDSEEDESGDDWSDEDEKD